MLAMATAHGASAPLAPPAPLERKRARVSLAPASESGVFEGYASLFNVVDTGGDMVMPGAFAKSLRKRGAARVKMLWQHQAAEPIGVWALIVEDGRGLKVQGRLDLSVGRAREALSLMRAGAIDGLSIGFRTKRAGADKSGGVRRLIEVDLWEISIVTFPMLPQARVSAVKGSRAPRPRSEPTRITLDGLRAKLLRLRAHRAAINLESKLFRLSRSLELRYVPGQPRVPAGSSGGGQWTSGGGGTGGGRSDRAAGVSIAGTIINICVAEGVSRFVDPFGNKSYKADYGCRDGRTITREGFGEAPGLILDPLQ